MRQTGILVVAFIFTLTVLGGGFFVVQSLSSTAAPSAAPVTTADATATLEPTAAPTARPTAKPTPVPTATPATPAPATLAPATPAPTARPQPSATPTPAASPAGSSPGASLLPDGRLVVVVRGVDYTNLTGPATGVVKKAADGTLTFSTDRSMSDQMEVDWQLPPEAIPAGATIRSLDVLVCGTGMGDFWESYGPPGSDPDEQEFTAPAADGCWHYAKAPGADTTVKAFVRLSTTMTVSRIEYTATLSR